VAIRGLFGTPSPSWPLAERFTIDDLLYRTPMLASESCAKPTTGGFWPIAGRQYSSAMAAFVKILLKKSY